MNKPEEIKKGLACYADEMKCGDRSCQECPYNDHPYGGFDGVAEDALAYIKQLEAKVPNWISVEDELPEKGVDVLYVSKCDGRIHLGRWRNKTDRGAIYFMNGNRMETATHWMPLPGLPEEGL